MNRTNRILLILLVLIVIVLARILGVDHYVSLPYILLQKDHFFAWYMHDQGVFTLVFFWLYVMQAAFALPGAAVLSLLAGYLFGYWGIPIVAVAASLGAVAAMLIARHILSDWVRTRFGSAVNKLLAGMDQDITAYLLMLRLIPLFPFFLVNIAMGLTRITSIRFFWVSLVGMLPGTALYVLAGQQLSLVHSVSDVLSFRMLLILVLMGLLSGASIIYRKVRA